MSGIVCISKWIVAVPQFGHERRRHTVFWRLPFSFIFQAGGVRYLGPRVPLTVKNAAFSGDTFRVLSSGITGTIPPQLGGLESLEILDLSSNSLVGEFSACTIDAPGIQSCTP